jgi:Xaa-Pro aminopeptidase
VGVYLGVHEGPQRISRVSTVPLEPGMILSNEPGYYREGAFGIRIENLVVVTRPRACPVATRATCWLRHADMGAHRPPSDRAELLTAEERDWLNAYHAGVAERIGPRVDADTAAGWTQATAPI